MCMKAMMAKCIQKHRCQTKILVDGRNLKITIIPMSWVQKKDNNLEAGIVGEKHMQNALEMLNC